MERILVYFFWSAVVTFAIMRISLAIRNAWRKRMLRESEREMKKLKIALRMEAKLNKDITHSESPSPAEDELITA